MTLMNTFRQRKNKIPYKSPPDPSLTYTSDFLLSDPEICFVQLNQTYFPIYKHIRYVLHLRAPTIQLLKLYTRDITNTQRLKARRYNIQLFYPQELPEYFGLLYTDHTQFHYLYTFELSPECSIFL